MNDVSELPSTLIVRDSVHVMAFQNTILVTVSDREPNADFMTTIRTVSNQAEAAFLLSLLQGNGFEAALLDEGAFHYSALMVPMRLQVADDQASEALRFLRTTPEFPPDPTPSNDGSP